MEKYCCASCFGNMGLKNQIAEESQASGSCSYCTGRSVALMAPQKLEDKFRTLLDAYAQSVEGKPLVHWLRHDWELFPDMDDAHAKELLSDILNDGEIVRQPFLPGTSLGVEPASLWDELREELMHRHRFFAETRIDLARLGELLSALIAPKTAIPSTWYRARVQPDANILPIEEMKAPPPHIATHGRANPAGIPYLYVASDRGTAISEVRPHTGSKVSVADFTISNDLRLIDLRHPIRSISPFYFLSDDSDPSRVRLDIAFLKRLGDELTRPVLPESAAFQYAPSQYLCEFIKKEGYNGVIYRSSIGEGMNLALFQPEKAIPGKVEQHTVTRVRIEYN